MKLDSQGCAIEYAKKIKELGIKQDSLFFWTYNLTSDEPYIIMLGGFNEKYHNEKISAFTIAELCKLLPIEFTKNEIVEFNGKKHSVLMRYHLKISRPPVAPDHWFCWYVGYAFDEYELQIAETSFSEIDKNMANACAKMLIYLIENKILELP